MKYGDVLPQPRPNAGQRPDELTGHSFEDRGNMPAGTAGGGGAFRGLAGSNEGDGLHGEADLEDVLG